ncbi:hypothetical protein DESC_370061 [Desulfosarcina cetonica]|nr:hypothetical protein DESC_370061 [Desulfosarcina cetonica]
MPAKRRKNPQKIAKCIKPAAMSPWIRRLPVKISIIILFNARPIPDSETDLLLFRHTQTWLPAPMKNKTNAIAVRR